MAESRRNTLLMQNMACGDDVPFEIIEVHL
jgi:hypothetical protein